MLRTATEHSLEADVAVGHQLLKLHVGDFGVVVRAQADRLSVGIDSRKRSTETAGNGSRASDGKIGVPLSLASSTFIRQY